jgi:hypothetical protein
MSYKRFNIADFDSTPATLATVATLSPFGAQTVANVASVATGEPETAFSAAALSWDDDLQAAFEERAAVLEYDGGWPRAEAERAALAIVRARLMDDPGLVPAVPGDGPVSSAVARITRGMPWCLFYPPPRARTCGCTGEPATRNTCAVLARPPTPCCEPRG